eukprot:8088409-Ditylum_brightwellii.AAC.1
MWNLLLLPQDPVAMFLSWARWWCPHHNYPLHLQQGCSARAVEAFFLFCVGTNKAHQETHHNLLATGGGLSAGMDNTYLGGLPDAVVPTVAMHRAQLREVGLELNASKTACYIAPQYRNTRYRQLIGKI